jgi:16S rRNA (guanine966-N2)-methyltransferase
MRIIAGERRGHKFDGPQDRSIRPTSDMVREAIFNILADVPEGRPVYDLFAGTGALGLEALSRGGAYAVFVEKDRKNAALIRRNLATLKLQGRGGVLAADAYKWAKTFTPDVDEPTLVLMDPPYRDFTDHPQRIRDLIVALIERMPRGSTLVVESDRDHEAEILPDPEAWDIRRYGGTQVAIRDLVADEPDGADAVPDEPEAS